MGERDEPAVVGRRVQRLRIERRLTQRQLAEPTYTPAYVSTLEAGRVRPSDEALRHIADRLGVDFQELATGRPARLVTDLRLRLTEAQRALATGAAEDAARQYAGLLAEAEEHGLPEEQATALLGLGECGIDTGDLEAARRCFERAEERLADAPLPARVPALRGRAVTHHLAGELRYAVYLLESTLDELNRAGLPDPDALLLLYASVIGPYMDMGAQTRAAQAAEFALALGPQVDDPALIARMHGSVARTFLAEGRLTEADASLSKATDLYRRLHLRTELANCHWIRGHVHAQNDELDLAEAELRKAQAMLPPRRAALDNTRITVELAEVLHHRGKSKEAATILHDTLSSEPSPLHSARAHRLLGIIAEDIQTPKTAEHHYTQALTLLQQADTPGTPGAAGTAGDLADLCRLLGDLLRRTGRTEAALDAYRTGLGHRTAPGATQ
ncbi:Transcriptional regulator, contains XRE-family HTH domain [Streptomyces sp. yr375]|uniref:helix-turn-helix domain-containing protein n=1 Tax=Streptomyces sp. yr375 TaxID=1761906 RepID=UPI0008AE8DC2|nr:helix-turn-helix transcriptional regulator [Streptomyces sp. yr375]SES48904.1 Transcriptional regulator, contains XRE-family HTH domain [Streptomyces sp. yr375]